MAESKNGSSSSGGADDVKKFWDSDDGIPEDTSGLPLVDEDKLWEEVLESYRSKNPDSYSVTRTVEAAREAGVKTAPSVSSRQRSFEGASQEAAQDAKKINGEQSSDKETGGKTPVHQKKQHTSADTSNVAARSTAPSAGKSSGSRYAAAAGQASRVQKITADGKPVKKSSKSGKNAQSANSKKKTSKKRSRKEPDTRTPAQKVRKFIICLVLWIIVIAACCGAFYTGYLVFYDLPADSTDLTKTEITIDGYETDEEVGEMLLDLGFIDNLFIYRLRCIIYDSDYVAGTYSISRSYNTEKILNILAGYSYSDGTLEE